MSASKPKKTKTTGKKHFEIKFDNSKIIKQIIETLSSILDEIEIKVTPEALTIEAMDPSRICLLQLQLEKSALDTYTCKGENKIGINAADLDKVLKRCANNETVELSFIESEQKIRVVMEKEGANRKRTFTLSLLELECEEVPMDNLRKIDYDSQWSCDPSLLGEAIKDGEIYSEILNILSNEEGLTFSSLGTIGEMEYTLDSEDLIDFQAKEDNKGSYSIQFLKGILKLGAITEKLTIFLKTDHPFKMLFSFLEGGTLEYYLAPRVEEVDFDEDEFEEFVD